MSFECDFFKISSATSAFYDFKRIMSAFEACSREEGRGRGSGMRVVHGCHG